MKFPTKFWDGYSQQGEAQLRVLDALEAPFAQRSDGTSTARRNGDFSQVTRSVGAPYLFGYVTTNTPPSSTYQVGQVQVDPEGGLTRKPSFGTILTTTAGSAAPVQELTRLPYVGDGYALTLLSDAANFTDNTQSSLWPVLVKVTAPTNQYNPGDVRGKGRSISFLSTLALTGYGRYGHWVSLVASGWDNATTRYRFGLAATSFTDGTNSATKDATRTPVFFTGNTGSGTMAQVAYPAYAGRGHYEHFMAVVGKGALQALHTVVEDATKAQIAPYLATSADHGATWTTATATFLAPYLDSQPGTPRATYVDQQLGGMARFATSVYLGGGKSLLVIPNGFVDKGGVNGASRYAPMAFLGSAAGGYSRIAWPPDTWYVGANGIAAAGANALAFVGNNQTDEQGAQYGFGAGCAYFAVFHNGVSQIMFTTNSGTSWSFAPVPVSTDGLAILGTIVRPQTATKKARLLFAQPNYARGQVKLLATDGSFAKFAVAGQIGVAHLARLAGTAAGNLYFTNYGGPAKASVHPGFPGEFDQPKGP